MARLAYSQSLLRSTAFVFAAVACLAFCSDSANAFKQSKGKSRTNFPKTTTMQRGSSGKSHSPQRSGGSSHQSNYNHSSSHNRGSSHNHHNHHNHRPGASSYSTRHSYRPTYSNNLGRYNYGGHGYSGHNHNLGYSNLSISPYGLGYSYSNRNFGISVGSAATRSYRPTSSYNSLPFSSYSGYYGNGYSTYPSRYYANPPGNPYSSGYYNSSGYGVNPSNYLANPYQPSLGLRGSDAMAASNLMSAAATPPGASRSPTLAAKFPVIRTSAMALRSQQLAENEFREGEYQSAAKFVKEAILLDENNGHLLLFSSHAQFAAGNYSESARDLEKATQLLVSDQWPYVAKNFRKFYGKNDYVAQTDSLTAFTDKFPNDHAAKTLRGFHYGSLGYADAATTDFLQALAAKPDYVLANKLLPVLGNPRPAAQPAKVEEPVPAGNSRKLDGGDEQNRGSLEEIGGDNIIQLVPQASSDLPDLSGPSN